MSVLQEFSGFDRDDFPPQVTFVCSNIKQSADIKETEVFKTIKGQTLNVVDLWRAEEHAKAEERRLWIRGLIKSILVERGKTPSEELLDAATNFAISNCIIPSLNPSRHGRFIQMLCCFCDGREFSTEDYVKREKL